MEQELNTKLPVKIHLTTQIEQEGQISQHVFDEDGQLVQMGSTLYLRYHEEDEESHRQIPVTLKIQEDGKLILTRDQDDMRLQLHFKDEQEIDALYQTPYGNIPIVTRTSMIQVHLQNELTAGEIMVDYVLISGQQELGKYQLRLIFQQ